MFARKSRWLLPVASATFSAAAIAGPVKALAAAPTPAARANLESEFRDPPASARPRVWWHWMNGNISKEGIAADLAWMKRVGIGGLQNFDIDLATQQVVARRLAYMTPAWRDAFRFAASEAERLGLELAIASSPGWSETGGPWVKPEDALKKLVWSETVVRGGAPQILKLAQPPSVAGPYQNLDKQIEISDLLAGVPPTPGPTFFRDARVVALPADGAPVLPTLRLSDGDGQRVAMASSPPGRKTGAMAGVVLPPAIGAKTPELRVDYGRSVTVRSLTLHIPGGAIPLLGALLAPRLEASDDGRSWRSVITVPLESTPSTVSFPAVTARYFRLLVRPAPGGGEGADPNPDLAMNNPFARGIGALLGKPLTIGLFQLHAEPRIDRAELKAGFAIAPDYYALPSVDDAATGPQPGSVIDLTDRLRADGTLAWTPPPGTWRIIRFGYSLLGKTNHPAPVEATGLETDKYDSAAVERYLELYLSSYREAAGANLLGARGVRALLTDSIEIGAANWTPQMIQQFKRLRGYDPVPWLPALTGILIGSRADSDRFLYDFRRTLSDLMSSEHYGTVAAVAHRHGLKVYGESIEGNRSSFGDDMAMRRYADYPMAAMWAFDPKQGPQQSYLIDIKGAASVAHLYGQNIVAAESLTAAMAPWGFGPADLKPIVDLEFVLGVNRPVIHTSVHVPTEDRKPGLSLAGIGQFFNRNESWAELATPWVSYLARNAYMLQQGRNVADLAYFYGEEAPLSGLYGKTPIGNAPTANAFDFVNADALHEALANDGSEIVSSGGARYQALFLGGSSRKMTLATLRRISQLVEGGATVIGLRPEDSPSLLGDVVDFERLARNLWSGATETRVGKGRVIASSDPVSALTQIGVRPDFHFTGGASDAEILFNHRQLTDGHSYFVVNRKARSETIQAHFRVSGLAPELWRAETGLAEPVSYRLGQGETVVPLTLEPNGSVHVVFRKAAFVDRGSMQPTHLSAQPLGGPWTVAFEPGRGAPPRISMAKLAPLDQSADPNVRYFSGVATYSNSFATPKGWTPGHSLILDLGEVREVAEVRVNGQLAGYAWHAPYRIEVGRLVGERGPNKIEIKVANLWVNRLIRDADPAVTEKVSWTSVPTYRPTAALRPSGLLGPVTLQSGGR